MKSENKIFKIKILKIFIQEMQILKKLPDELSLKIIGHSDNFSLLFYYRDILSRKPYSFWSQTKHLHLHQQNLQTFKYIFLEKDLTSHNCASLRSAASQGNAEFVQYILSNFPSETLYSDVVQDALIYALNVAVKKGHWQVLQLLLMEGSQANWMSLSLSDLLWENVEIATCNNHWQVIEILQNLGYFISKDLEKLLIFAQYFNKWQVAKILLQNRHLDDQYIMDCFESILRTRGDMNMIKIFLESNRIDKNFFQTLNFLNPKLTKFLDEFFKKEI